jgi:ABC-type dipeptide/oligopeptide/nickel transport system permease subunit
VRPKTKRRLGFLFWASVIFLGLLLVTAIIGPHIRHPHDIRSGGKLLGPSAEFWLGTDELGRDIFARLTYGARVSLLVGIVVQTAALALGITIGMIGALGPKWLAGPVMRFTDGMFAFPDLLLAILIVGVFGFGAASGPLAPISAVLGSGLTPVIIALAVTAWPSIARLVRGQVATLKEREYVQAARAMGARPSWLVLKHILPHLWGIILAVSMVDLAAVILAESSLSFLGIGVQAPDSSWGTMINQARIYLDSRPELLLWPCAMLSLTIFALNFVGDGLRDLADPKS